MQETQNELMTWDVNIQKTQKQLFVEIRREIEGMIQRFMLGSHDHQQTSSKPHFLKNID